MRVEQRTIYIAVDGQEFRTEAECLRHDVLATASEYLWNHVLIDWRDASPNDVMKALLEKYDITPKAES